MTAPELSRPVPSERPPASFIVKASPEECAALARRFGIVSVESLSCRFTLRARGRGVAAEGELEAQVTQECVVTLEPVAQRVHDEFSVRFVPEGEEADDDNPASPDELPFSGGRIDLGEAAAEQLALALDPYPRSPAAAAQHGEQDAGEGTAARDDGPGDGARMPPPGRLVLPRGRG